MEMATHLVIVEDGIGHAVFSGHSVSPQLLHEKHLIGQRRHDAYNTKTRLNALNKKPAEKMWALRRNRTVYRLLHVWLFWSSQSGASQSRRRSHRQARWSPGKPSNTNWTHNRRSTDYTSTNVDISAKEDIHGPWSKTNFQETKLCHWLKLHVW